MEREYTAGYSVQNQRHVLASWTIERSVRSSPEDPFSFESIDVPTEKESYEIVNGSHVISR